MAGEKRLIDVNALLDDGSKRKITEVFPEWNEFRDSTQEVLIKYGCFVKKLIQQQPTVDAVEVVRCNGCDWYDPECEICKFWGGVRHPDHYCSEGERRTDDNSKSNHIAD